LRFWKICSTFFNVPVLKEKDAIERVIFLFNMANGWENPKERLAKKSFDVLCQNFFKVKESYGKDGGYSEVHSRLTMCDSSQIIHAVQNFFRIEKEQTSGYVSIRNFSRTNKEESLNEKLVESFLLNMGKFLWKWREYDPTWCKANIERIDAYGQNDPEIRKSIEEAKPWMIEVLFCLNGLELLRKRMLNFNEPCLIKLKEIAFRSVLYVGQDPVVQTRSVTTREEACYTNSVAALLLKEYVLKKKEHKRLKLVLKKQQANKEADPKK